MLDSSRADSEGKIKAPHSSDSPTLGRVPTPNGGFFSQTLSKVRAGFLPLLTIAALATGATGCKDQSPSSLPDGSVPTTTSAVNSALSAQLAPIEPSSSATPPESPAANPEPLHPTSTSNLTTEEWQRLDRLENLDPKNSMATAIEVYEKILSAKTAKGSQVYFINPYDQKIVEILTLPPELVPPAAKPARQEWLTAQRLRMAANPKYDNVPIITDSVGELPLVEIRTPETSKAAILANKNIKAIETAIPKYFKTTTLYKSLHAKRFREVKIALAKNAQDLRNSSVATRMLLKQKPTDLKQQLDAKSQEIVRLGQERRDLANELVHSSLHTVSFQSVAVGQVASNANATGMWQIKPDACADVAKTKPYVHCNDEDSRDPDKSTQIAMANFDFIFKSIEKEVTAFERFYGITSPEDILIPAIITASIAGPDQVKRMLKGYTENPKLSPVKGQIVKGEISGADLFMWITTRTFRSSRADFNSNSLSAYPRAKAGANLLKNGPAGSKGIVNKLKDF